MDRCGTCHLAIDRVGYEEYPQPFRTHPNLEAYVGSASPHPVGEFGCTVCHEGMGQSVSFEYSSHTPVDDVQMHEWEETHGWGEPHLWDFPMLPANMTEASCAKCHRGSVYVPDGPQLSLAYGLYERAGCYACHTTRGFQGLRKPGPDLTKIGAKLTPEWVSRWVREPRAVKPSNVDAPCSGTTRIPTHLRMRRATRRRSMRSSRICSRTRRHIVSPSPHRRVGTRRAGRSSLSRSGVSRATSPATWGGLEAGPNRTFGQPLQNVGNKTTFEWLFDWVRDPKHFSPDTYMPDMRLTDQEVADVATYLVGLVGAEGEGPRATYDDSLVAEVLTGYLRSVVPAEEARATIAEMSTEEQQLELGRRAIGRYGCYSCHTIKGFEDTQPIGIELSEEGSKLLQRLDFAFVHDIPHTKVDWFKEKLRSPRSFDRSRVLQPLERLRMPDFEFNEDEVLLLGTAIMSCQSDVQPLIAQVPGSARHDALREGRNLVRRRNCVACHEIEGAGGGYRELVSDPALAPPLLTPEGAKVKPEWLYAFLREPIPIRPWLNVRMPTFGLDDSHWNGVLGYFGAISSTIGPFRTHDIVPEPWRDPGGRRAVRAVALPAVSRA